MCLYIYCTFNLLQLLDVRDNFVLLTVNRPCSTCMEMGMTKILWNPRGGWQSTLHDSRLIEKMLRNSGMGPLYLKFCVKVAGSQLLLITNRNSHTCCRLVPTSMTLNGAIALSLRLLKKNSIALQANYVTVVEDRPI